MLEGKRQKQVSAVLLEHINPIFLKLGLNMLDNGMVSISKIQVTPDLLEARIFISFFNIEDTDAAFKKIEDRAWEIKKLLADKVKHQLRRIPVIHYFKDDTLDYVFKMEDLFKQIQQPKN